MGGEPVTQYDRGRRFEWRTRDLLRDDGYEVVRGAGSKGIDLIAMKPGQLLLVGCKLTGVCAPAEWDRLVELAGWVDAIPILAVQQYEGPRGRAVVELWRLTGRKVRGAPMGRQPAELFRTDEVVDPICGQPWAAHPGPSGGAPHLCPRVRREWVGG
jgi:Holliday junction resolvase